MFNKNKKWVGLIAFVLVVSVVMAGCSGGNKENKSSNGGASQTPADSIESKQPESEGKKEEPIKLIWYTIGTPPTDLAKVNDEINKHILPKINATVEMKLLDWGEYDQKMKIIIGSGEAYDIAFTSSWANDYFGNSKKGAFYELDSLIEQYGQGVKSALNPAFLEGTKVNGHNYGLPTNKELPQQRVFRFNMEMADKHGLDIANVKTIDDLEPLLKAFKENEPGIAAIPGTPMEFLPFDYPITDLPFIGVAMDTQDYKLINTWDTPETMKYLKTMHKYYEAGYLPMDVATLKDAGDYFKTGKWLTDTADTQPYADNLWSGDAGYKVVSMPMHDPIAFNWSVAGALQAINAKSKHPEKAMEFLNLLYTDAELINLVDFGIENVHYKKTGDNTKDAIPDSGYSFPAFSVGDLILNYLNTADPADKWDQFKKFNDSSTKSPLLGFQVDTTNITTELANLKNTKEATYKSLFSGTLDPETNVPKITQKLKDNGLDKVMAELQKQIDEWRAKQ